MSDAAAPRERIALAAAPIWAVAAAFAGRVGVWLAIGSVAVVLGAVVASRDAAVRARLRLSWRSVVIGLAAGGVMIAATYLLSPLLRVAPALAADVRALYAAFRAAGHTAAIVALGPVVLGEELVWRGAVQGALERRAGPTAAAALAAALYALAHAPIGSPLLVVTALGCGLVWGALRAATGSLVPSIVSHALWDAVVLVALPLVPR